MTELINDPALQTVALGTAMIGGLAGFVGTFAVVRRQSLLGDAISHAALPGLTIAFLFGTRSLVGLILGAAFSSWIAILLVGHLSRSRQITHDSALGGALAVFFGIGLALLTYINKHVPGSAEHGLERYLFGQAATLRAPDLLLISVTSLIILSTVILLWKPIKLLCFDSDFAGVQGWPIPRIDWLLTSLIVLAVVTGLQAVGVVLISALLVGPAIAAQPWSNRLGPLAAIASVIGMLAGFGGTVASHLFSSEGRSVPTGPVIVLTTMILVALSLTLGKLRMILLLKGVKP